jgi:hypothetical protein
LDSRAATRCKCGNQSGETQNRWHSRGTLTSRLFKNPHKH